MFLDDYGLEYEISGWNRYLSILMSKTKERNILKLIPSQRDQQISVYLSIFWHGKSVISLAPFKIGLNTAKLTIRKDYWDKLTNVACTTILQDFKVKVSHKQYNAHYKYLELDLCI